MSDPYFQTLFAERIGGASSAKAPRSTSSRRSSGPSGRRWPIIPSGKLLDFGIGENDAMAPESVRRVMAEEINKPENRGYADNGTAAFKEAVARLMQREFGVALDPATEVNHCIGSKTALAMLPACFINPGDVTLMTVPGYPVAGTHTTYYGGVVYKLPLLAENDFFPDLDAIPADVARKAKLLVLCYPNSPTGKTATPEFYERAIAFAKKHEIVIIQDAAHGMLSFDRAPNSFLAVPGARDVGVEVHSLSKGYDMIGWRIGWVCGNARIVRAFADMKDNCDSGQFMAIQKAAAAALDDPEIPKRTRAKYRGGWRSSWRRSAAAASSARCRAARTSSTRRRRRALRTAGRRRAGQLRERRSGEPVSHHRAIDLHGAVGRRGAVPAVQRDVRSGRREGGRRADGGDRIADQESAAGVLVCRGVDLLTCESSRAKNIRCCQGSLSNSSTSLKPFGSNSFKNLCLLILCSGLMGTFGLRRGTRPGPRGRSASGSGGSPAASVRDARIRGRRRPSAPGRHEFGVELRIDDRAEHRFDVVDLLGGRAILEQAEHFALDVDGDDLAARRRRACASCSV